MNANTHPIEFLIASLLNLLEFTCYIINEIAGHHQQATTATAPIQATPLWTTIDEQEINALAAKVRASIHVPTKPHTNPLFTTLQSLTVKQLQATTGIRSSRYRKADLIALAAAY